MALMLFSPLSGCHLAVFPQVLESSGFPPVPNQILESHNLQSFSLLATKPIIALEEFGPSQTMLKPSLLHLCCKEASKLISVFQGSRPSEVSWYCPSAINEYRELAVLLMRTKFSSPGFSYQDRS